MSEIPYEFISKSERNAFVFKSLLFTVYTLIIIAAAVAVASETWQIVLVSVLFWLRNVCCALFEVSHNACSVSDKRARREKSAHFVKVV